MSLKQTSKEQNRLLEADDSTAEHERKCTVQPTCTCHTGQRHSTADTPTRMAMVSSSLTSSRAPMSAQVTLGTVTKPSLLAEGWTEDRATMKSFSSMRSPCSRSSERGSWFRSNTSSLCNSSLKGAIEGKSEKRHICWKTYFCAFKNYYCNISLSYNKLLWILIIFSTERSHFFYSVWMIWPRKGPPTRTQCRTRTSMC